LCHQRHDVPIHPQEPENIDFKALYRKWKVAQAAAGKQEAKLYSKMFAPRPARKQESAADQPAGDAPAAGAEAAAQPEAVAA
jgi:hypothetical protein